MKNYISPEFEVVEFGEDDIITTSRGTETPAYDEDGGIWSLEIG